MTTTENNDNVVWDRDSASLFGQIISANVDAAARTSDALIEYEKDRYKEAKMIIEITLDRLEDAFGGTVREYEAALRVLKHGYPGGQKAAIEAYNARFGEDA